ncbi:MAG TPA: OmpA family protein [Polyangiaceae bacterium]|jgi:outer membrane protein OmpA-like peptidoglycan-associated protein|nr:OmpA family protein [Polyangiaceae bacterium]
MKISTIAVASSLFAATACAATTPTPELVNARQAYDRARTDPTAQLVPDSVLTAKQALDKAESVHDKDPGSDAERSYSYVAERRAELALALGENARVKQQLDASDQHYSELEDKLRTNAQTQLGAERSQVSQLGAQLVQTQNGLAAETDARKAAEARAQRAMESLNKIAQVKEEARGMVITLSGQVLFVTGKSELLPAAQDQLDQVARALKDQGDLKPMVVEGYTDSVGSDQANLKLSKDRADAVRNYLISKGIPSDKISAVGKGKANPVASNDTPDGRANNRRVEIVVQGGKSSSSANSDITK